MRAPRILTAVFAFSLVLISIAASPARADVAPVVTAPATTTGAVGTLITFTVSCADPDGEPILSLTAAPLPSGAAFTVNATNTSGTFSWTPGLAQGGTYSVTFTGSNGMSGSATTAISVIPDESAPVVTAPATASGNEGSLITFTATATDPDGQPFDAFVASGSAITAGATFTTNATNTSGTFSWTPTYSQAGSYSVTFTAYNTLSATATTAITVVNVGPVVTAPGSLVTPGCLVDFTVSASSPTGLPLVSLTAAPLPAGATFTVNAANTSGTFHWTPSSSQFGIFNVTFTATDSNGATGSATTVIQVISVDRAPVVLAPFTASGPEGALLTFTVTAVDPDGVPITSFTASSIPPGAFFTVNASNSSGTFVWTPTFTQAGSWTATFTACSPTCPGQACALSGSATTIITITDVVTDRPPVVVAPATFNASIGILNSFTVTASDPDGDAITSLTASGTAITAGGSFTANATNTGGTFSWMPGFSQEGSYSVTFTASNALTGSATTFINAGSFDFAPVVTAPASVSGSEGTLIMFTVTASDANGDAITSLTANPLPLGATFTSNAAHTSGTFSWTPTFSQAGTYSVIFTATNALSGSATTVVAVTDECALPVADAGGPYAGVLNAPIHFDGSGSSDPSGSALTYAWDFGDGTTGAGVTVDHTYSVIGVYTVTLTVQSPCGSATDVTTATINQFCATAFTTGGNKTLRLGSGKSTWCVEIEPLGTCYANGDVDLTSIVMQYGGGAVSEISAISGKTAISGDKNQNGIEEITACFQKEDLRLLFSALPAGENTVTVTIRMDLITGGQVFTQLTLRVFSSGPSLAARVTPNPFNPRATLSFRTTREGFARASLFDASGRLVRTLLNERSLAPGYHDVPMDGRGNAGEALASGIYLYRLETSEGMAAGRVVLLK